MTILVGYDESEASARALARAAHEARGAAVLPVAAAALELPLDPRDPHRFGTDVAADVQRHAERQVVVVD